MHPPQRSGIFFLEKHVINTFSDIYSSFGPGEGGIK